MGQTAVVGGRETRRCERRLRLRRGSAVGGWRRCGSQPHGLMDERTVSVGERYAAASGVYGGNRRLAVGVGAARSRTVSWTNGRYRWARGTPLRATRRCERRLRKESAVGGWRRCGSQPHGLDGRTDGVGGRETRRCERRLRRGDRRLAVGVGAARSRTVSWTNGRYRWARGIGGREARRCERRLGLRRGSAVVGWRRCGSQPHGLMDERTVSVGERHAAASGALRRGSAVGNSAGWQSRCGSQPHGLAWTNGRYRWARGFVGGRETRRCERRLRRGSAVGGWCRCGSQPHGLDGRTDGVGGRETRRCERRLRRGSAVGGWRRCGSQPHGLMDERTLSVGERLCRWARDTPLRAASTATGGSAVGCWCRCGSQPHGLMDERTLSVGERLCRWARDTPLRAASTAGIGGWRLA